MKYKINYWSRGAGNRGPGWYYEIGPNADWEGPFRTRLGCVNNLAEAWGKETGLLVKAAAGTWAESKKLIEERKRS